MQKNNQPAWQRAARAVPSLLASVLLIGLGTPPLHAQVKGNLEQRPGAEKVVTTTTTYEGWTVTCTQAEGAEEKSCSANFRIVNQQNNQNVLVWLFGRNAKGEPLSEFLTLTDILIKPGLAVSLDGGKPVNAEFISCGTGGCRAAMMLDDKVISRMKAAKSVNIDMTRIDGQVIQFSFPIPGIEPALADVGF